jgi:fucose 4-O-acetylase-like acetyltransferase
MSRRADPPGNHQAERIWFLDTLRYWLVLLIILYHAAQSQTPFLWPVNNPRVLKFTLWLVVVLSAFVMPIFFFIAGYFALQSLRPRGAWRFVKAKFTRLVLPAAFVLVFLNPVHRYIHHYTRGFDGDVPPMGYLEYWPYFLTSWTWFEHGNNNSFEFSWLHLWFVNLLFVFFVVTACVHKVLGGMAEGHERDLSESPSKPKIVSTILGAAAIAWIGVSILNAVLPGLEFYVFLSWLDVPVPAIVIHVVYFLLGIVAYRRQWFRGTSRLGPLWLWAGVFVAATAAGIWTFELWISSEVLRQSLLFRSLCWFIRSMVLVSAFVILLTVAQRFFNRRSAIHQQLAANSYRMYLLHIIVLVPIQLAFLPWTGLPAFVVFVAVSASAIVGTYAIGALTGGLLRRMGLGWMT